jgi:hypothetical protein
VLATGETEKLMITELILSLFIPFTLGGGGGRAGKRAEIEVFLEEITK